MVIPKAVLMVALLASLTVDLLAVSLAAWMVALLAVLTVDL